jgi:hypothetical protein
VPGWILILQAAKEWSIPPWQVEDEATLLWWQRWRVFEEEVAEQRKSVADRAGQ